MAVGIKWTDFCEARSTVPDSQIPGHKYETFPRLSDMRERNWWRSVTCWPCFSSIPGSCRASVTRGWMASTVIISEVFDHGALCWDLCFVGSWRRGRRKPSFASDLADAVHLSVFSERWLWCGCFGLPTRHQNKQTMFSMWCGIKVWFC